MAEYWYIKSHHKCMNTRSPQHMVWELALRSLPNCWQEISLSLSFISAWVCSDCFLCFRPMFQRKRTPKHDVNILESLVFSALECLRLADRTFSNATFWGKEPKQPPSPRMLTHWHLPPGTKCWHLAPATWRVESRPGPMPKSLAQRAVEQRPGAGNVSV